MAVDTNSWIRFLLYPGSLTTFWQPLLDNNRVKLLLSKALLAEIVEVAQRFATEPSDFLDFCRGVIGSRRAMIVPVASEVTDCEDPDDNFLLALALDDRADVIVSSDRHLLAFRPAWRTIRVITYEEFGEWRKEKLRAKPRKPVAAREAATTPRKRASRRRPK